LFGVVSTNNYIEFATNREIKIFVDDRFDMYPIDQLDDLLALENPDITIDQKLTIFEKYRFDGAILGKEGKFFTALLETGWREEFTDGQSVLLVYDP
jgi:hypothetical protein